jgi:hypothetical protein
MLSVANFNDGTRPHPPAPIERAVRFVIQDLRGARINTNLRFGRKHQWKLPDQKKYIAVLLCAKHQIDPVAISKRPGVIGSQRAVNGNNRFRTLLAFVNNEFGIEASSLDPNDRREHTYYYNEIPAVEAGNVRRRNVVHLLPEGVRLTFDEFPIMFNVREGLTEAEEIEWYHELNTNTYVHTEGQLLLSRICNPLDPFVDSLLATFPMIKPLIDEQVADQDADSLGYFLANVSGHDPVFTDERDKDEKVLLSVAIVFNLLVNGQPYNARFHGEFSEDRLAANSQTMRTIFERADCADEFKAEWVTKVNRKPFLSRFWSCRYMLGPMAWSIATEKPGVVDIWVDFLNRCRSHTIDARILDPLALMSGMSDDKVATYAKIWELLNRNP